MKKERLAIQFDRRMLEHRIRKVKDVLLLAEQLSRLNIGLAELLAFHSAMCEKADMEKIPLDAAAYRTAEDITYYRQLGGLKQEHDKAFQQAVLLSLIKLQRMGISEDQIINLALQMNNGQQDVPQ
jgi:hypothetical protein